MPLSQIDVERRISGVDAPSEALAGVDIDQVCVDVEGVFRASYVGVARAIFRIIRDPGRAEEIAVEVFIRWSKIRPAPDLNPEGWLYRTAIRMSLDELRRRARRSRYEALARFVRPSPTPEEIHVAGEEQEAVRCVLGCIGRRHAELLLLRNRGFSYEEIASALSLKPGSVGTLLRRAQAAFRKEYISRYGQE